MIMPLAFGARGPEFKSQMLPILRNLHLNFITGRLLLFAQKSNTVLPVDNPRRWNEWTDCTWFFNRNDAQHCNLGTRSWVVNRKSCNGTIIAIWFSHNSGRWWQQIVNTARTNTNSDKIPVSLDLLLIFSLAAIHDTITKADVSETIINPYNSPSAQSLWAIYHRAVLEDFIY